MVSQSNRGETTRASGHATGAQKLPVPGAVSAESSAQLPRDAPFKVRAMEELARIQKMRVVDQLREAGRTQQQIAAELWISQATVHRILRQIQVCPEVLDESPLEVINLGVVGLIGRTEMMRRLSRMTYTYGRNAPDGSDAYMRGTWDDVADAVGRGLISTEEYETLSRLRRP